MSAPKIAIHKVWHVSAIILLNDNETNVKKSKIDPQTALIIMKYEQNQALLSNVMIQRIKYLAFIKFWEIFEHIVSKGIPVIILHFIYGQ